jgi:TetR/AcrR family transcriptional repressor of nem operon
LTNKTTGHIIHFMSKRESKKAHILCRGLEVMKRQGYNGTSVKDIVDAAEVPKGSFYNYFASKEAFVLDAIAYTADENARWTQNILQKPGVPAMKRLENYFQSGAKSACGCEYEVGCFLGNMAQEMSDSSESIRCSLEKVLKTQTAMLAEVIEEILQECKNVDLNADLTAEFLFNAWEGALMRAKASKSPHALDAFMANLAPLFQHAA